MNTKRVVFSALAVFLSAGIAAAQGRRGNAPVQQTTPQAADQQKKLPPPEEKSLGRRTTPRKSAAR